MTNGCRTAKQLNGDYGGDLHAALQDEPPGRYHKPYGARYANGIAF